MPSRAPLRSARPEAETSNHQQRRTTAEHAELDKDNQQTTVPEHGYSHDMHNSQASPSVPSQTHGSMQPSMPASTPYSVPAPAFAPSAFPPLDFPGPASPEPLFAPRAFSMSAPTAGSNPRAAPSAYGVQPPLMLSMPAGQPPLTFPDGSVRLANGMTLEEAMGQNTRDNTETLIINDEHFELVWDELVAKSSGNIPRGTDDYPLDPAQQQALTKQVMDAIMSTDEAIGVSRKKDGDHPSYQRASKMDPFLLMLKSRKILHNIRDIMRGETGLEPVVTMPAVNTQGSFSALLEKCCEGFSQNKNIFKQATDHPFLPRFLLDPEKETSKKKANEHSNRLKGSRLSREMQARAARQAKRGASPTTTSAKRARLANKSPPSATKHHRHSPGDAAGSGEESRFSSNDGNTTTTTTAAMHHQPMQPEGVGRDNMYSLPAPDGAFLIPQDTSGMGFGGHQQRGFQNNNTVGTGGNCSPSATAADPVLPTAAPGITAAQDGQDGSASPTQEDWAFFDNFLAENNPGLPIEDGAIGVAAGLGLNIEEEEEEEGVGWDGSLEDRST
ncbi:hypothetical protein MKZ38_010800 [Zalerion maritima]|uniref:Uncharacterized protein n=1 Tax=Zalerion maritima TaxID=339359 RepID=A0AAD5WXS9_9PEZI|nr:hypothetical protein MKZ38_010800 [Zalerion maritima]